MVSACSLLGIVGFADTMSTALDLPMICMEQWLLCKACMQCGPTAWQLHALSITASNVTFARNQAGW